MLLPFFLVVMVFISIWYLPSSSPHRRVETVQWHWALTDTHRLFFFLPSSLAQYPPPPTHCSLHSSSVHLCHVTGFWRPRVTPLTPTLPYQCSLSHCPPPLSLSVLVWLRVSSLISSSSLSLQPHSSPLCFFLKKSPPLSVILSFSIFNVCHSFNLFLSP